MLTKRSYRPENLLLNGLAYYQGSAFANKNKLNRL
jgi:hypothetical protein